MAEEKKTKKKAFEQPRPFPKFEKEEKKDTKDSPNPATSSDINTTINRDRALKYKWLTKHMALRKDGTVNDLIEFFDMQRLADATRDERLFELLEKGKEAEQMERDEPDEGDNTWIAKTLAGLAAALLVGIPALVAGFTLGLAAQIAVVIKKLGQLFKTLGKGVFKGLRKIFPKIFGKGSNLLKTFDKIRDTIKGFGQSIGKLGKTFPKVIEALKKGFNSFTKLLKSVGSFFVRFLGIGKELKSLTKDGKKFADFFGEIKRFFTGKLAKAFTKTKGIFKSIGKYAKIVGKVAKFFANFGKILGKVFLPITVLITLFDVAKGAAAGYKEGGFLGAITGGAKALFDSLITSVVDTIVHWGGKLVAFIANFFGFEELAAKITAATADFSLGEVFESIYNGIKDIAGQVSAYVMSFIETVKGLPARIIEGLSGVGNAILGIGANLAEVFANFDIGEIIGNVTAGIKDMFMSVKEFFSGLGEGAGGKILEKLGDIGSGLLDGIIGPAKKIIDVVKNAVTSTFGKVPDVLGGLFDSVIGFVDSIWTGIKSAIHGLLQTAVDKLGAFAPGALKSLALSFAPEPPAEGEEEGSKEGVTKKKEDGDGSPAQQPEKKKFSLAKLATGGRIEGTPQGIIANIGEQNVDEIVTPEKNITAINNLVSTESQQTQALLNSLLEKSGGEGSVSTTINKTNNNVITPTVISPRSNESTMGRINAMSMTG